MDLDRLSSYRSVVWTTYSTILSFIRLAQAGFRYTGDGLSLICEGCETILEMVTFIENDRMLDPRQTRFHSGACKFVDEVVTADQTSENRGYHVEGIDGAVNCDCQHSTASDGARFQDCGCRDSLCQELNGSQNDTNGAQGDPREVVTNNTLTVLEPPSEANHYATGMFEHQHRTAISDVQGSPKSIQHAYKVLTHPSYPVFISYNKRLESFTDWKHNHIHRPEWLAQAGFFYAGYADCVRCFQCGLGLRSWKPGDDVHDQHRKHRPSCPFLGTTVTTGAVQSQHGPTQAVTQNPGKDGGEKIASTDDITVTLLKREGAKLKERLLCKVCLKAPVKDLFLPCGELYACADCSKLLTHCPACNKLILATSSIYFA